MIKGYIDFDRSERFTIKIFQALKKTIHEIGDDPNLNKENIKNQVKKQDLANFVFISSIFDYANIAPSWIFSQVLLDIYLKNEYLFEPSNKYWDDFLRLPQNKQKRVLTLPLLRLAGLFRLSFNDLIFHWKNIIEFLRNLCNCDARTFLIETSKSLGIDLTNSNALSEIHDRLKNKNTRDKLGINFPYGDKNGRLLYSMMTNTSRGYGILNGITDEHLRNFDIPVDSQIIRISLNTGLIRIEKIKVKKLEFNKKSGDGIDILRSDFAVPPQHLWKLIATKLDIFPVDLDYYLWSLGSILCKRYGELCYLCPLSEICWSYEKGSVAESRGALWPEGCFSFARPTPNIDKLILRTCEECSCKQVDLYMNKTCNRSREYMTKQLE